MRIRSPHAVRPGQHVLDALSGYLQLTEALFAGRSAVAKGWNFGPTLDSAWPVEQIVGAIRTRCRRLISSSSRRRSTKPIFSLWSFEQARRELGWKPQWGIKTALEKTLEWYMTHRDFGELLTDEHIREHMAERSLSDATARVPETRSMTGDALDVPEESGRGQLQASR